MQIWSIYTYMYIVTILILYLYLLIYIFSQFFCFTFRVFKFRDFGVTQLK